MLVIIGGGVKSMRKYFNKIIYSFAVMVLGFIQNSLASQELNELVIKDKLNNLQYEGQKLLDNAVSSSTLNFMGYSIALVVIFIVVIMIVFLLFMMGRD